ncbi:hypothetical protein VI06_16350 [Aquitalea magnusonii]|nr:hypothetical protein VI06_16350 [Aquitalea magnusonii]
MSKQSLNILQKIRQRGHLLAGVSKGIFGLSYRPSLESDWQGFDIDLARAVATSVLGDASAVEFISVASEERCRVVASGLVDIGTFNASATLGREAVHDVLFPQTMLYDGEALMVRKDELTPELRVQGISALRQRIVAIQHGATTESNLRRHFGDCGLDYELRNYATPEQALQAYASGECNLYALDLIPLTGERLRLADPDAHLILDEPISKEAMGPVVSAKDSSWARAVSWIMRALIEAEELGLNSNNCHHQPAESMQHVHDFLHPAQNKLDRLGLVSSFPLRILQQVGNYAEIFNKNLGCASPLQLPRSRNALWSQGGLLISPSFQ